MVLLDSQKLVLETLTVNLDLILSLTVSLTLGL